VTLPIPEETTTMRETTMVAELDAAEMAEVNGGGIWSWLFGEPEPAFGGFGGGSFGGGGAGGSW
jgi:uncharacterized membrane protein YgcG